jgi:hypothetical protein
MFGIPRNELPHRDSSKKNSKAQISIERNAPENKIILSLLGFQSLLWVP